MTGGSQSGCTVNLIGVQYRLRRIFLQDCRRKNVGVGGKGIQGNALRRGFFSCKIGEIDKQDVSLIFLQFLTSLALETIE